MQPQPNPTPPGGQHSPMDNDMRRRHETGHVRQTGDVRQTVEVRQTEDLRQTTGDRRET